MTALPRRLLDLSRVVAIAGVIYLILNGLMRASSGPKEGSRALDFDLPLADGSGRVSLSALRGKPVVMEVFASWCSACRRATPRLAEAFRDYHSRGVEFLGVSVDSEREAAAGVKRDWEIPFDVAIDDGSLSQAYRISMLPTLIYIDRDGVVRHVTSGVTSRSEIEGWLAER